MIRGVKGGQAIPLGKGFYYMRGRKHSQGGIDISKNLEVEDKEVVQVTPKHIKVYSAQPILNGISPAKAILRGANPNKVFNAQENYKDRNNLNDDGSKKAKLGKEETITETNDRRIAESDLASMKRKQKAIEDNERIKNDVKTLATNVAENVPGIDNLMMIRDVYNELNDKNYLNAAVTGSLAMIPFIGPKVNKVLKEVSIIGRTFGLDPKSIYYNIAHKKELKEAINKAKDFYFNDVTKRLDANTANDLINNSNNFKRIKFGYVYDGKGGTVSKGSLHLKSGDILIDPNKFEDINDIDGTLVHELRHRFDGDIKSHNTKYTSIKSNTPDVDINPEYKERHALYDYEKKANNTQTRYNFYKKDKNNTDEYIRIATKDDFENTFLNTTKDNKVAYNETPRYKVINNLNNIPVSTFAIGTAGATLINKFNQNQKAMGGITNRVPFTGGRKQSKKKANLGTEEQVQQQRKTRRLVNETNALGFNVEHPEAEILPNIEVVSNVTKSNSVTLPSSTKFYGTEWNFGSTPQLTLHNGVYVRNYIPETIEENSNTFTDWEKAGRYPFGKYRPPFRRYNSIRPIGVDNNSNSSFFINDGKNLGVTYPILNLNGYTPTFDYNIEVTDNTPSIRTGIIPFRPFAEISANDNVTTPPTTVDSDQSPVKESSVSQTTVRPTSASVKPTKPTRRSVSPVTTTESYVDRSTNDFRLPSGPDVGIATKITNKDVSPVAKPTAEYLTTDVKRRVTNNNGVVQNTSSNFFKDNSSSLIGAASDLLSTGLSYMSNRNAIRNMSAPKSPVITPVRKLKTNYNINPQIDNIRETTNTLANEIANNSSSSASVLNRINKLRLSGLMQKNQLYGQKQNAETQLINQDALNQQQVAATNVAAYNQYQDRLTDYNNKIADLNGENNIGLISGINSVIQNSLKNKKLEEQFIANLVATGLPYKDVVNFVTKRIPLSKKYKLQMQE